jgi:two-component system response regulator AtoC
VNRGEVLAESSCKAESMLWGLSPVMQALRRLATDTASKDIPIVIVGDSGTGKSVLAVQIHHLSGKGAQPFIVVNSRSFKTDHPPALLPSSDTGPSAVPLSGATFFLDNICELELEDQRRLLAILPEDSTFPGGNRLKVRIISAARRSLEEDLRCGRFVEDLYFRVNGVCLRIPPLRERKEDIPQLAEFFLSKYQHVFEQQRTCLSEQALTRLATYSWPGNVRQLENTIKKIVATGDVDSAFEDLIEIPREPSIGMDSRASLKKAVRDARREVERELIARALSKTHWNRKRAAQELQISYKSLLSKMKQMGVAD